MIRKQREERIERERLSRLESEKRREDFLWKKRFRLPKIIVTYYDDKDEKRSDSPNVDKASKLPNLVNIPSSSVESNKGNKESDVESQGSKGDRLELPEPALFYPEGYSEETVLSPSDEQIEPVLANSEAEPEAEPVADSDSPENEADVLNVVTDDENKNAPTEQVMEDMNQNALEDILLEDKQENVSNDVSPHESVENGDDQALGNDNMKVDEQKLSRSERDEVSQKHPDEQLNADNKNGAENFEEKEKERNVEEKNIEEEKKEVQMNYLVPPSVQCLTSENGSDHGSIGDADDTGISLTLKSMLSLVICFYIVCFKELYSHI